MKSDDRKFKFQTHPDFRLNGERLRRQDMKEYAEKCELHGEVYEQEVGRFLREFTSFKPEMDVYTSGSTGSPKKISLDKESMINSAKATGKFFDLPEGTTALLCLPVSYIAGKMMLVRAMALGWDLNSAMPKSNPLDQIFKRFDFCAMTPFQLDNSVGRMHLIGKLIVGGGKVSERLKNRIQDLDTEIFETYGMTETITHIAARQINSETTETNLPFRALKGISLSQDERNCLVIKAPQISEDPIVTNDIVKLETFKKFYWEGRIDRVINSGGVKIFPEQVERKLDPDISNRFFITGMENPRLGEELVLFIEGAFSEENLEKIRGDLDKNPDLKKFERPKKIYFVEKFEETHTGKIHRKNTAEAKRS